MARPTLKKALVSQGDRISPSPESTPHEKAFISCQCCRGIAEARQVCQTTLCRCNLQRNARIVANRIGKTIENKGNVHNVDVPIEKHSTTEGRLTISTQPRTERSFPSHRETFGTDTATLQHLRQLRKEVGEEQSAVETEMSEKGLLGLSLKRAVPKAKEEHRIGLRIPMRQDLPIEARMNGRAGLRNLVVPKIEHKFCFPKLFSHPRDITAKSRDIPPKSLASRVSRDMPNCLAPTPSCGKPPPHQKISVPKSLGLCSFFLPETSGFLPEIPARALKRVTPKSI